MNAANRLLSMIDPKIKQIDWMGEYGNPLKQSIGIREAADGFKVGRKWMRWSANSPTLDQAAG